MQAGSEDIRTIVERRAQDRFGLPLKLNFRRLKEHDEFPDLLAQAVERADLCFDLSGDFSVFEAGCRDHVHHAQAFGIMEALLEEGGGRVECEKALYLIKATDHQATKVGISANPYRRLLQLQEANFSELSLWGVIFTPGRKAKFLEQRALEISSSEGRRLKGEWTSYEPGDLFRMILAVAQEHNIATCNAEVWVSNLITRTKRLKSRVEAGKRWDSQMMAF